MRRAEGPHRCADSRPKPGRHPDCSNDLLTRMMFEALGYVVRRAGLVLCQTQRRFLIGLPLNVPSDG